MKNKLIEQRPLSEMPNKVSPAEFQGLTFIALIECGCEAHTQLWLTNTQLSSCPACGTIFGVDRISWDRQSQIPKVALQATPVSAIVSPTKH